MKKQTLKLPGNYQDNAPTSPILFFDGDCMICSKWVRLVLAYEKEPLMLFSPLQSDFARDFLSVYQIDHLSINSVVFIEYSQAYTHSEAIIRLSKYLKFPWNGLTFLGSLPQSWRDSIYRLFARNRYRLSPAIGSCSALPFQHKKRFILDCSEYNLIALNL